MSTDLTELFLQALQGQEEWLTGEFGAIINLLRDNPKLNINWDKSVPEFWAGIESDERAIAVIRLNFPLIIVLSKYLEEIEKLIHDNIVIISVNSFKEDLFSIKAEKIKKIFPDKFSGVIDYDNFTIQQLIYATV